jgi:hypothetical protein
LANLTPVSRAYQSFTASTVRVSRPVGTPVDPSAWEKRDRFVRGGPRIAGGEDRIVRTAVAKALVGDDAVWDRLHTAFQKHPDAAYRAYYAAETFRHLPRKQRERLTQEFLQMHPLLMPLFWLNIVAPHVETLFDEIGKLADDFMRLLISDLNAILSPAQNRMTSLAKTIRNASQPQRPPR